MGGGGDIGRAEVEIGRAEFEGKGDIYLRGAVADPVFPRGRGEPTI